MAAAALLSTLPALILLLFGQRYIVKAFTEVGQLMIEVGSGRKVCVGLEPNECGRQLMIAYPM